jgi:hypothetical protein
MLFTSHNDNSLNIHFIHFIHYYYENYQDRMSYNVVMMLTM